MEPMVRPVRPASWNRRNRLMNLQGTVWNRPEPEPESEPFATGSKWNRNRVELEPDGTGTEPAQPGPWLCLIVIQCFIHPLNLLHLSFFERNIINH